MLSLFSLDLGERIERRFPSCRALSGVSLTAPVFANAARCTAEGTSRPAAGAPAHNSRGRFHFDPALALCLLALLPMTLAGVAYFHYREGMEWLDSMYFVVQAISGVDFGNIGPRNPEALSKAVAMGLLFLGGLGSAILFALVADMVLRKRIDLALGHRRYSGSGHVIVCGLGACGYRIVEELRSRGEKVLEIERNSDGRFTDVVRQEGIPVMVGDAELDRVLLDAGVMRASAVIGATNNDLTNLKIGLSANALNAAVRVVLRIFDQELAANTTSRLGIDFASSTSHLAAPEFVRAAGFEERAAPAAAGVP